MVSSKKIKIIGLIIGFAFVSFLSYQTGVFVGQENVLRTPPAQISNSFSKDIGEKADFSVFWEAWRKLEINFLKKEKIDYQKMIYGAIKGMAASTEDPYTFFFTPEESKEFEEELAGNYQGVGMEVAIKNKKLTVVSPLEGAPAQKAGIKSGDTILEIDNNAVENLSLEEAIKAIRGLKDTEVTLLINRETWEHPQKIILKRAVIKIPTLKLEFKEQQGKDSIVYLKIYQFNKILDAEFREAAQKILNTPSQKIILDLRNNPGGFLEVAQHIGGWFLEKGKVITWQDSGEGKERKAYYAQGTAVFSRYPIVVLINQGSASGAEILAGALRDNRGVKLIGEKTFGKGSVQEQFFLQDNSSLKVTIAKWLTPNGESIDEKGLLPDIEVALTEKDWGDGKDPQLDKALEIISQM
ncbi:S41 family peptidase [Patescibacteria group bacterium]|nr:S41 family peptidase [Patescibacteria group bacterium]